MAAHRSSGVQDAATGIPGRPRRIGLLDHLGGGNLGDDATQTAMMQGIRGRWPDAAICGFSMNPADTQSRHSIVAYPIRRLIWANPDRLDNPKAPVEDVARRQARQMRRLLRGASQLACAKPRAIAAEFAFLAQSLQVMRTIDVFVISGGGQLLDSWGGPWAYPYTILKWLALARLAGTPCWFANVGAGPVTHRLSKGFIRRALRLAGYVSFRDHASLSLARAIGYAGPAEVSHDSVYALDLSPYRRDAGDARNRHAVGLSPMAYCDPRRYWKQQQSVYDAFVGKLAAFGAWLNREYRLTLFSTDIWFDSQTIDRLADELRSAASIHGGHPICRAPVDSLESLLSCMAGMDFIVTCRFHGVVFAHLMNIPVIALSHHPKVATLMADLGLAEYCLDIETFTTAQLIASFTRLVADAAEVKARMAEKATQYRTELTAQFDRLFPAETIP